MTQFEQIWLTKNDESIIKESTSAIILTTHKYRRIGRP